MDPRVQAGIIAFVSAIVATAIAGLISYNIEKWKNKRAKKEETLKNLFLLRTKLSPHKIDMHSDADAVISFNQNYDEANLLMSEIMMSLALYFPIYEKVFEPVLEESAYYWKLYKDHLLSEKRDYHSETSPFQRSLKASFICDETISVIMKEMKSKNIT